MDSKDLQTLELPKILARLADCAGFSASRELALALAPTVVASEARQRQAVTSEARLLLQNQPGLSIGGARDVRPQLAAAVRGAVLEPSELLDVKYTSLAARELKRSLEDDRRNCPLLAAVAQGLYPAQEIARAITRCLDDRGEVLDRASQRLAAIRAELRITRERLTSKLERLVTDPKIAHMLQEAIVTQREGRFVVPLRSEFKGQLKSVIHDQSSSGATLFVEPLAVVELNNELRQLELAEREEVRRILQELSEMVAAESGLLAASVQALAQLDLAFSKARYAEALGAAAPRLKAFGENALPGSRLYLLAARHPLLEPESVVPIDITLDPETQALVITGPNTGGKTVALKTAGLLALMAQCGLHLPAAHGSELMLFKGIYADIGDEQSIEQSLSTFSSHVSNIVRILQRADQHSLVLLDELGAGTDPQEGSALASALLDTLVQRGATTLVATHFAELKAYAHLTPGVQNASVQFDLSTLSPTYHLAIGLPGRSNALAIAERLGLDVDIIQAARQHIPASDLEAESLLDEIYHQLDVTREARAEAQRSAEEAGELRGELRARLASIENERLEILQRAQAAAQEQLEDLEDEISQLRKRLEAAAQPLEVMQQAQAELDSLQEQLEQAGELPLDDYAQAYQEVLAESDWSARVGELAHVHRVDADGLITAINGEDVEIQVGRLRLRARIEEIGPPRDGGQSATEDIEAREPSPLLSAFQSERPPLELHLRGQTVDEALETLARRLDAAYLAGMPILHVIHGKGSGKLRQAVRQALERSPYVTSFEAGLASEGGEGVTIVHLSNQ